jgi:hypothetical protein
MRSCVHASIHAMPNGLAPLNNKVGVASGAAPHVVHAVMPCNAVLCLEQGSLLRSAWLCSLLVRDTYARMLLRLPLEAWSR